MMCLHMRACGALARAGKVRFPAKVGDVTAADSWDYIKGHILLRPAYLLIS